MDFLTKQSQSFLSRHLLPMANKGKALTAVYEISLSGIQKLEQKLHWIRKTHGLFDCLLNPFLKQQIRTIKNRIAYFMHRCRSVLQQIDPWKNVSLQPFA